MSLVATLISCPARRVLRPALVDMASRALNATDVRWLSDGVACDLFLADGFSDSETREALVPVLSDEPIDIVIQPREGRAKRILVADMDSTMIDQECIDELADEIGLKAHVAEITARSMNGEIAFEPALRERVALLKGMPAANIASIIANRLTLASGGRELVATMRQHGAWTALVSGGFTAFTGPIAALLGFGEHRANVLLEEGGVLTGTVAEPILGREAKADALTQIAARLGLSASDAIAVGDGANDLAMIGIAGTGIALRAKPAVAAQAKIRIDHGDLTALLYIQGYAESEFVR